MADPEGDRDVGSEDEADGELKKAEDAYANEFADDDDYGSGAPKKQKVQIEKPSNPGWCLLVKLKFKDMGRVMKLKDLFGPFAAYVKKNEPNTLSYSLIFSDSDPLSCTIFERFTDRDTAYKKVHRESSEAKAFRAALDALEPEIDGHSYYEDLGYMAR